MKHTIEMSKLTEVFRYANSHYYHGENYPGHNVSEARGMFIVISYLLGEDNDFGTFLETFNTQEDVEAHNTSTVSKS